MVRLTLWLGGMSGVGKTTAARVLARRHDLHLYTLDSRTYAHAERMDVPALQMSADELWLDRAPEQMAADFEAEARERFPLVLADLAEVPADGAPVLVEGPQLLPELVGEPALFVVADTSLQRRLLDARGSFTPSTTRDPERARRNRTRRDELLTARIRAGAAERDLALAEITDITQTEDALANTFTPVLREWLRHDDHGDVAARRRAENDRRFDQWRRYAAREPRALDGVLDFACECHRRGCTETVAVKLADADARPLVAHD